MKIRNIMKIPSKMWAAVLFNIRGRLDESNPCLEIYALTKVAKLKQYEYLKEDPAFSDTLWDLATDLKQINLEYNADLHSIFFKKWKDVEYATKSSIFKNVDMPEGEIFNKDIKKYYIENMTSYPTIMELNRFRKDLSQEKLKEGLNNLYNQINFKFSKQQKGDYWANHISSKEEDKLLDLLELSGMKKEELTDFDKIGFFNEVRQERFNRINEKKSTLSLLENEDSQVYLLKTKINQIVLLRFDEKLGSSLLKLGMEYTSLLIKHVVKIEKLQSGNNYNPLIFVAYDKPSYEEALIYRKSVSEWIENNTEMLIAKIKNINKENKTIIDMDEETKELADKIRINTKLSIKYEDKNSKKIKPQKI